MNDSIRLVPCRRHSAPRVWAATLLILCTALAAARLSAQQNQSVTGNLSVAGTAAVNSTAASTSSTTGALTVGGGVGVQGDVNIGGGVSATAFTAGSVIGSPSGLTLLAGGPNQNITLNPSGTGSTILNGNVGIGTAAPTAKLDVNGAVKVGTQQIRVTNSGAQLYLSGTSGGDVSGVYVGAVNEGDNANEFALAAGAEWGNASGAITSWTARATSAGIFQIDNGTFTFASAESLTNGSAFTPVPLMTLMAGGKLGLGTTNPYSRFSVRGGNIDVGGFNGGGTYGIIFTPADASSWLWQANTGNALQIGSGAAVGTLPRVTIQAAGNVGIGTASPGALLDVAGNAKVQGNADVTGTLSTGSLQIAGQPFNPANYVQQSGGVVTGTLSVTALTAAGGDITGGPSGLLLSGGGSNQNITLTPSGTGSTLLNGNVGIGTSAPNDAKLHISRSTAGAALRVTDSDGDEVSIGEFGGGANRIDVRVTDTPALRKKLLFWGGDSTNSYRMGGFQVLADNFEVRAGAMVFAGPKMSVTDSPGSFASGVEERNVFLSTGAGDADGTSAPRNWFFKSQVTGTNPVADMYGLRSALMIAGTGGTSVRGTAFMGSIALSNAMSLQDGTIGTLMPQLFGTGNIESLTYLLAAQGQFPAPGQGGDLTGTINGLVVANIGRAAAMTTTGISVADQTKGRGNVYGLRGLVAAGEGKYNLYIDGSAANVLGGQTTITNGTDSTASSSGALVVTGGAGVGKNLNVGGNLTVGGTLTAVGGVAGALKLAAKLNTTDSPDSFLAGVEERNVFLSTGAGDASGTSAPRNWFFKSQVTGTNPVADMYGLRSALMIAGTGGTSARGTAFMGSIALNNAMSLQEGTIGKFMPQLFGTGNIESLTYLLAAQGQFPAPGQGGDLTGTINGLVVANIGRAAAMTTTGISVADQTKGRGNVYGLRGLVAAGEGKYNLYIDGSAANVLGGQTTITNGTDSTASSSGALVVTGGAGVGKNLNVGGDAKFGGTIYGNESGLRLNTNGDRLDVMGTEMLLGADETGGRVRTDAFVKRGRWGAPHYLNAEKPVLGMWVDTRDTANNILYGGGSSVWNTATKHVFYTAPNTTTLNGTSTFTIDNTRVLVAPSTASSSTSSGALVVNGGAGIGGNLNVGGNLAVTGTFSAANFSNGVITGATGLALNAGADNQNVSFGTTGSGGVVMQRSSGKAWQRLSSATDRAFLELSGASNQTNGAAPDGFYAGLYLKAQDGMVGNYASIENSNQAGLPNARLNFVNLSHAATNAAGAVDILTGAPVGGSLARVARFDAAGLSISTGLLAGGLGGLTLSAGAADQNVSLVTSGAGIVTTNARLGIGISASTALADGVKLQLHSADSSQTQLYFTNSDSGITASDGLRVGLGAALTALVWNNENAALRFGTNNAEQARITETGEVLLGTVTRSGNGRLQLADHTTAAGGIGLGSDVSIFRSGIGELSVSTAGGLATKWDINRNQLILGDIRPVSPDAVDLGAPSLSMRAIYGRTMLVTGTAASTSKDTGALIVEGGTGIEGNVNAGGSLGVAGDAAVHGGLTVDSATTLKSGLTVTGPTLLAGMLTATSGAVINGTTNLQTASVAGTSSFGDTMTFASAGNTMGTISWGTTPIVSTQLVAGTGRSLLLGANGSATTGLTVAPSANVGVGTTSPTEALHVLRTGSNAGLYLETVGTGNPAVFMKQGSGSKYLVLDLNPANIFSIGWDSPVARIGTGGGRASSRRCRRQRWYRHVESG